MLDPKALRTRVFESTGLKLSEDDPLFVLVLLNEAILSEYIENLDVLLTEYEKRFLALAERIDETAETMRHETATLQAGTAAYQEAVARKASVAMLDDLAQEARAGVTASLEGARAQLAEAARELAAGTARLKQQPQGQGRQLWVLWVRRLVLFSLIGAIGGGVGGVIVRQSQTLSADDIRYLEAGRDIIDIMPRLDRDTRKKLEEALKNNK
jgi:hypothetical protein